MHKLHVTHFIMENLLLDRSQILQGPLTTDMVAHKFDLPVIHCIFAKQDFSESSRGVSSGHNQRYAPLDHIDELLLL